MAFVRIDNLPGRLFVPDRNECAAAKHPCADCECCQFCGPVRCAACRGREAGQEAQPIGKRPIKPIP
jgi:hypothetical protein